MHTHELTGRTIGECLSCTNADAGLFPDADGVTRCTFEIDGTCPLSS